MFKANYISTLKTLLRHPATMLACAAIVLSSVTSGAKLAEPVEYSRFYVMQSLWNISMDSCWLVMSSFLGIVISSNILSDIVNGFSDVLSCSKSSFFSFFASKILAFWTLGITAKCIYSIIFGVRYWFVQERMVVPPFWERFSHFLLVDALYLLPSLLVVTAMSLFLCAVSGVPVMGVGVFFYSMLDKIFNALKYSQNIFGGILYFLPKQYVLYTSLLNNYPQKRSDQLQNYFTPIYEITPQRAIFSIVFHCIFAVVVIIISYFMLKKRYNRS